MIDKLKYITKHPIFWFALLLVSYSLLKTYTTQGSTEVIGSDGRGYYAYLPALFIYNDSSFEKTHEVDRNYAGVSGDLLYLVKDKNGNTLNKYFPGISVLQAPFFGMACLNAYMSNYPIDGYSAPFVFWFYFGSLFYVVLGVFFFYKFLQKFTNEDPYKLSLLVLLIYFATPIAHYSLHSPSFSHLYSFALFSLFGLFILRIKDNPNIKSFFLLGLILGLIFIIRPTNIMVVLIIPFLFGSIQGFKLFVKRLSENRFSNFLAGILGFFLVLSLLLFTTKWQTGHWFQWSYEGEGFRFLHPKIFKLMFSWRIGLFIHTPILILSIIGLLFASGSRRFLIISWLGYFMLNTWVIASWWCWDYESPFGVRPYTEHIVFLVLPLFYLFKKRTLIVQTLIIITALVGIIRFSNFASGYMTNQRFTSSNYFESLLFWKSENVGRWNYTKSCRPFGEMIKSTLLLNVKDEQHITPSNEFLLTVDTSLPIKNSSAKCYYKLTLDKKIETTDFNGVFLVMDAIGQNTDLRYYNAVELFNDRYEGLDDWKSIELQGIIHDNLHVYDKVTFYIWNSRGKSFKLKNVKLTIETYES